MAFGTFSSEPGGIGYKGFRFKTGFLRRLNLRGLVRAFEVNLAPLRKRARPEALERLCSRYGVVVVKPRYKNVNVASLASEIFSPFACFRLPSIN
jgi:hypothetical protein